MPAGSRKTAPVALAIALAAGAWLAALSPAPARADDAPAQLPACGFNLSDPIFQKWTADGGQSGRMGCPAEKEIHIQHTASGATGVQANFTGGASILWHASGGHAGQTYTVQGCFYRLYAQFGGASGWLGLPTADATSTNDGQTQPFEGGSMTYVRAERTCSADHGPPPTPTVGAHDVALDKADRASLDLYFDATRQEYFTSAAGLGAEPNPERYQKVRSEAYVFVQHPPGTVPLRAYWNEARGDHLTIGTVEGERAATAAGYDYAGPQGFVFPDPQPDTRPLKLFWSVARQDFMLVATPESEADAKAAGYDFVRIEGYAPTTPGPNGANPP